MYIVGLEVVAGAVFQRPKSECGSPVKLTSVQLPATERQQHSKHPRRRPESVRQGLRDTNHP